MDEIQALEKLIFAHGALQRVILKMREEQIEHPDLAKAHEKPVRELLRQAENSFWAIVHEAKKIPDDRYGTVDNEKT